MKAILVRIGVDHSYGGWNAPANPESREFIYVPIPESPATKFHPGCERKFEELQPPLERFAQSMGLDLFDDMHCPRQLLVRSMHLDPDFEHLTYGDVGDRRGSHIRELEENDLLVFYAGLRPCQPCNHKLLYALVGVFLVDEVVSAASIPQRRWNENAHTRKQKRGPSDIVVRAKSKESGRFARFIPIGEYRERAYRVRRDLLKDWGGLTVNDGYIQRSARPPRFLDANRFRRWLDGQDVALIQANYPSENLDRVIMVHLRQPRSGNPEEMRSDPFFEFGSFGCTRCHRSNLMHPARIDELEGARMAFAQGGPLGFRLVMLTPPVRVVRHKYGCELRWTPAEMPLRYTESPLLIDNDGESDFEGMPRILHSVDRPTWLGRFSSKFRSRRTPLQDDLAAELCEEYDRQRKTASATSLAQSYEQSMPIPPNIIDRNRRQTYQALLRGLGSTKTKKC